MGHMIRFLLHLDDNLHQQYNTSQILLAYSFHVVFHAGLFYRSSQLRFVLAPGPTLASQTLVPQRTSWNQIEVCPQGGAIVERMSEAIAEQGGCALIVDYGEDDSKRHTLRVS